MQMWSPLSSDFTKVNTNNESFRRKVIGTVKADLIRTNSRLDVLQDHCERADLYIGALCIANTNLQAQNLSLEQTLGQKTKEISDLQISLESYKSDRVSPSGLVSTSSLPDAALQSILGTIDDKNTQEASRIRMEVEAEDVLFTSGALSAITTAPDASALASLPYFTLPR